MPKLYPRLTPLLVAALSSTSLILLAGCALSSSPLSKTSSGITVSTNFTGRVIGGQQPVSNASIQLYAVATTSDGGTSTPLLTSAVTTDSSGRFTITSLYTCPTPSSLVYITATGGNPGLTSGTNNLAISLITLLGPCGSLNSSTNIMIDERTTVAAVWALAPFMTSPSAIGSSSIDSAGLSAAFTFAASVANSSTGAVPGPSLPSGATAPIQQINTLANILAPCINSTGGVAGDSSACGNLFAAATPNSAAPPTTTATAALNLARDPSLNVAAFFALTSATSPYQPQLASAPTDWSITLSGNAPPAVPIGCSASPLTGSSAFTNFTVQQPQVCRLLLAANLPAPYTSPSVNNTSTVVPRQSGQMPIVPPGFKVTLYASGFGNARYLLTAGNGDILLSQPSSGTITILRGVDNSGHVASQFTYASGLSSPYGLAFYPSTANPQYLYVANTTSVQRFPYTLGDTTASAAPTTLISNLPNGGHVTRNIVFTTEATPRLLVAVGSYNNITNTDTSSVEFQRANILAYSPSGTFQKVYAAGLRNPVGLTLDSNGTVWASVNERDGLGDNLPADYATHVQEDGFYGWPWYYNGPNADPTLPLNHPELAPQTIVADTLLQPHFAPLEIAFYNAQQFPTAYRGNLFVASHGSWNKSLRGGYELVRVPVVNGVATGVNEDFMTGFVNSDGTVWGRPAGVTVGADGAIYVADDASNSIWRITYTGS
jgi:glucose/arabinose dehydrogenase